MKYALSIVVVVTMTVLSFSNLWLSSAFRTLSAQRSTAGTESERLRKAIVRLEQVRVQWEARLSAGSTPGTAAQASGEVTEKETLLTAGATIGDYQVPDLSQIADLTPEEKDYLDSLRSEMPKTLGEGLLLQGDVDALLQDPGWNPSGSVLTDEERTALEKLLKDYRFFARKVMEHRVKDLQRPEVDRLRAIGAYVENAVNEQPVPIPDVSISHGEVSPENPDRRRIYYFPPQDYPELYRLQRIERQRSYEAFVKIYHAINRSL